MTEVTITQILDDLRAADEITHHYHESPDIKHNRRPAPGLGFHSPNLPTLIADCIRLGKTPRATE